ncbi:MAG: tetratricopeptide repeat protein [Flavobacteriales bacterium]
MKLILKIGILIIIASCEPNEKQIASEIEVLHQITSKENQDSIIKQHLENGAWKEGLYSREWQEEIDKGLAKDSTIAYLWQQKAMPLFKQGKYELGMIYLDKAVQFDKNNQWQEYRAFMKCIFSKTYKEAIEDFEDCKLKNGNSLVMDHSYNFYIALSKIQLNEFAKAEELLEVEVSNQLQNQGEELVHHLDLFYLGISRYEQKKYEEAIMVFDRALQKYPQFSEALYYKSNCEGKLGNLDKAKKLLVEATNFGKQGFSINEDNSMYERYPYQIRWGH